MERLKNITKTQIKSIVSDVIDNLDKKKDNSENKADECVICLEDLENTDYLTLSCNHKYHLFCMVKLMMKTEAKCPLCRKSIRLPNILEECQSKNKEIKVLEDENQILLQENARYEYIFNTKYSDLVMIEVVDVDDDDDNDDDD